MSNKEIDVFIISYNRLEYLKQLITWLERAGFENIHIVDNNSTYPPLLEYFKESKHKVHRMDKNYGHLVVWECGKFNDIIDSKNYVVTDSDVLPIEECPLNVTSYFSDILAKFDDVAKVGFSLKIDDLPNHFIFRDSVIDWEIQFWSKRKADGLFDASIDTTFALYRPEVYPSDSFWWKSIRTDYPYMAKHLPWYSNSSEPTEENLFYQKKIKNMSTFWSVTDVDLLQKYNDELMVDLKNVYSTHKWKILQVIYMVCYAILPRERFRRRMGKKKKLALQSSDAKLLQKNSERILVEISNIKSSGGWKMLEKAERFFKKSITS